MQVTYKELYCAFYSLLPVIFIIGILLEIVTERYELLIILHCNRLKKKLVWTLNVTEGLQLPIIIKIITS